MSLVKSILDTGPKMLNLVSRSLFIFLVYSAFTLAIPTSNIPSLSLFPFASNNVSDTTTVNLTETIPYPIPSSSITLLLNPRPNIPIPPSDLNSCLYITSTRVLAHIRNHGDGPLLPSDDPYKSIRLPDINCKFAVRSWFHPTTTPPQGGRVSYLTYGVVHTVLRGLLEYMLWPDPHYWFISFTVNDVEKGRIGVGSVGPSDV